MENYPKISCVMVTTGRIEKVRRSIECYRRQTYPMKELVILSQGNDEVNRNLSDYIRLLQLPDISFITAPETLSLGGMRNTCIELTQGQVICQWDDDDLYHPFRLMRQYNALVGDGVIASIFQEHLEWFEDTDEIYWIDWSIEEVEDRRYLHGTAMYWKDTFCAAGNLLYPEYGLQSGREEDWNAVQWMLTRGRIAGVRDGYQYIYTYHGNNIYWRAHHELVLQKRVYTKDELLARRPLLERSLRECGVDRPVKICAIDGPVFEYVPRC